MRRGSHHGHCIYVIFMIVAAIAIFGGGTMLLWNALMPTLFALPTVTFLQACGLVVLTRLLFGSHAHALMFLGGKHHGGHFRGPFHERFHDRFHQRWNQMTPEERKQFRDRFQNAGFDFWARDLDMGDESKSEDRQTEEKQSS